jgi:leader peptidase (prepilin peptidase)/N-methyltransferase
MNQPLLIAVAAVLGLLIGYGTHVLNQVFAASEEDADAPKLPLEWLWAPVLDAGLLGYAVYRFGASPRTLLTAVVVVVLVQVLVFDARHRLILNRVIYPAILLALVGAPWNPLLPGNATVHLYSAGLGALLAGGLFYLLVLLSRGGIGLGDAKLSFFLGATLGLFPLPGSPIIRALLYGVGAGGVVAAILLLSRVRSMRDYIPYGPYLCLGAFIELLAFGPGAK